jgi:hypothetical protein
MAGFLKKTLVLLTGAEELPSLGIKLPVVGQKSYKTYTERELIQMESEIGSQLFGPIPPGHHRQFFNLDRTTWIWYEEWIDPVTKKRKDATIRYEVHHNGILKAQEGARYNFLEGQELTNFIAAVQIYYERVMREIYHRDPTTGQKHPAFPSASAV